MSAELRQTIRSILVEELAAHGIKEKSNTNENTREEFVTISSDNDLSRFVRRILDLGNNKQAREDIESGRYQFRLTQGTNNAGQSQSSFASASAVNFEQGLITEKQINNLPDDVSVIKLGKTARLTPLAQDAVRQGGMKIERVKL